MACPSPQGARGADIPEKDLLLSSHGSKARVVGPNRNVEDLVAVRIVGLDQSRGSKAGSSLDWIVQVNGPVR